MRHHHHIDDRRDDSRREPRATDPITGRSGTRSRTPRFWGDPLRAFDGPEDRPGRGRRDDERQDDAGEQRHHGHHGHHHDDSSGSRGDSRGDFRGEGRGEGRGRGRRFVPGFGPGSGPGFGPAEAAFGPGAGFGPGGPGFGPGGPGFGPGFRPGFGPGPHGRRGPHGPGRRAGRGDIRAAVLLLLAEEPMHGYQLIQEIGRRSGGRWRPSPGAIYPALQLLEDEGLVTITAEQGRKLASLTEAGTTYVTEHADELGAPFDDAATRPQHPGRALREAMEALGAAAAQVARTGTEQQAADAVAVLERARRDLYLVLAGERVAGGPTSYPAASSAPADVTDATDPEDDES